MSHTSSVALQMFSVTYRTIHFTRLQGNIKKYDKRAIDSFVTSRVPLDRY